MNGFTYDKTNALCGLFFILAGAIFTQQSLAVDLGTWRSIGPGGMPVVLSLLLVLLGVVLVAQSIKVEGEPIGKIAWRGMPFILLAPILFGLTVRGLGFVASVFLACLLASFASYKMKPWFALLLSVVVTAFSTAVFSYGLGLPFERFGPWLRF